MKSALLAAAAMPPLETRSALPLETREDNPEIAAVTQAIAELRAAVDASRGDADTKLTTELKKLTDRLDDLEVRSKRPRQGDPEPDDEAVVLQKRAWSDYLRGGEEKMTTEVRSGLIVGDDTKGGYLAPADFAAEVVKGLIQFSPVRQLARVGSTALGEVELPKRTGRPTASWTGEEEDSSETGSSYGMVKIPVDEASCYVDVSLRLLEDAAINVETEIRNDLIEEFGRLEGSGFVAGNGVKKPLGFTDPSAGLSYTPTGNASNFASSNPGDALLDLMYSLHPSYRASGTWMMNGTTLAAVRKFKDSTGQYLWQPSIAAGQPETLLGRPVVEAVDMSDVGANAFPVAFGDFSRCYRIYDKSTLAILRDPFSQATKRKVRFHARRRTGGRVLLAEAVRLLKCATS